MNAHPEASPRTAAPRRALTRVLACALMAGAGALGACRDLPLEPRDRLAAPGGPSMGFYDNPLCQAPAGQTHPADTITATEHWYASGNPHWVTGDISVENGAQLRIHAGAVVCFDLGVGIRADGGGQVAVDGDASARVVLTALHPEWGWSGVELYGTPAATSFMGHARIEYARTGVAVMADDAHTVVLDSVHIRRSGYAAVLYSPGSRILHSVVDTTAYVAVILGDSTRFTKTTVRGTLHTGVHVVGTAGVQLLGGRIEGSGGVGLLVDHPGAVMVADPIRVTGGASYPLDAPVDALARLYNTLAEQDSLAGNARDTLYVRGGTLTSVLYAVAALPWRVTDSVAISTGGSLHAQPGAAFAFEASVALTAQNGGRLLARGSAAARVRFTAADTAARWRGIRLQGAPSSASYVTNAHLEYASGSPAVAARDSHAVVIDSTVFRQVGSAAVLLSTGSRISRSRVDTTFSRGGVAAVELSSNALLESTLIRGAGTGGIIIHSSLVQVLSCEVRESHNHGIDQQTLASAPVNNCNLVDNGGYGIITWSDRLGDMTDNWWGDAAGPFGPSGDGVGSDLDYTPWRTTPYTLPYVP